MGRPWYVLAPGEVEVFDCCEEAVERQESGLRVRGPDHSEDCDGYDGAPA